MIHEEEDDNSYCSTNDLVMAEAFLRCSRLRSTFDAWKAAAAPRMNRFKQLAVVADMFHKNYTSWSVLQQWHRHAQEQARLTQMSMVAWSWHAKRFKRRVVQAWRAYCDTAAVRRCRIRDGLECICDAADARQRLQAFYFWLGYSTSRRAASEFQQLRTQRVLLRQCIHTWRHRWIQHVHKKQRAALQVAFLSSRHNHYNHHSPTPAQQQQQQQQQQHLARLFSVWFRFWAARKAQALQAAAAQEAAADQFHSEHLARSALDGWRSRRRRLVAARFHRARVAADTLRQWRSACARTSCARRAVERLSAERERKLLVWCVATWARRAVLQNRLEQFTAVARRRGKVAALARWKLRLVERRDAELWRTAAASCHRQFVLKRGFDKLLQAASRFSPPSAMTTTTSRSHSRVLLLPSAANSVSTAEGTMRSLLATFEGLMLTRGADLQLVNDAHISEAVRKSAQAREREREQIRALIVQLQESLCAASSSS